MTLQSSGDISLANLQTEFGGSNPISLNEYYAGGTNVSAGTVGYPGGTATPIPSSGTITLGNFYGAAAIALEGLFIGSYSAGSNSYGQTQYRLDFATESLTLLSQLLPAFMSSSAVGAGITTAYTLGNSNSSDTSISSNTVGKYNFTSKTLTVIAGALLKANSRSTGCGPNSIHVGSTDPYGATGDGFTSTQSGYLISRSTDTVSIAYTNTINSYNYGSKIGVQSDTTHYMAGGAVAGAKSTTYHSTISAYSFLYNIHTTISATLPASVSGTDGINTPTEGIMFAGGLTKGRIYKLVFSTNTVSIINDTADYIYYPMSTGKFPRSATAAYFSTANDSTNSVTYFATQYSAKLILSTYTKSLLSALLPAATGRIGIGSLYY
jgi:hypothetical protein